MLLQNMVFEVGWLHLELRLFISSWRKLNAFEYNRYYQRILFCFCSHPASLWTCPLYLSRNDLERFRNVTSHWFQPLRRHMCCLGMHLELPSWGLKCRDPRHTINPSDSPYPVTSRLSRGREFTLHTWGSMPQRYCVWVWARAETLSPLCEH